MRLFERYDKTIQPIICNNAKSFQDLLPSRKYSVPFLVHQVLMPDCSGKQTSIPSRDLLRDEITGNRINQVI